MFKNPFKQSVPEPVRLEPPVMNWNINTRIHPKLLAYFAATQAMNAFIAAGQVRTDSIDADFERVAKASFKMAQAMNTELNRPVPGAEWDK